MKVAIQGCAHGELENIYNTLKRLEDQQGFKVDLLICCGDFQATRNEADLRCMAIPPKYYDICTFYKYYNGEKVAPVLTIFISGNHEASNYLQELPYGGWVAPNIYYLGYAGVVNVAGIRIGGLSGIYKGHDYMKGRFEHAPYNESTKRSVYHIRNIDIFRLKQLTGDIDVFLSHDWPCGVWNYGNKEQLIKFKPHFRDDIETGKLGSKPTEELLNSLQPTYWFAAHLHCKFAAVIPHNSGKITKFLSLDKCLPKRRFLQIVDIPHDENSAIRISYDLEWLTILRLTNHLLSVKSIMNYLPGPNGNERWSFQPTDDEKADVLSRFDNNLMVPENFEKTAIGYDCNTTKANIQQPCAVLNPQTVHFCTVLGIDDPVQVLLNLDVSSVTSCLENSDNTQLTDNCDETIEGDGNKIVKSSLKLPDPINCAISEEIRLSDDSSEEKQFEETVDVEKPQEVSTVKKFKRRNYSIYGNQQDDEDNN